MTTATVSEVNSSPIDTTPSRVDRIKMSAVETREALQRGLTSERAKDLGDTALKGAAAGLGAGLALLVVHKAFGN